jgi:hypothetical protein
MVTNPQGRYEVKTRVTFFLPVNDTDEEQAFLAILRYLQEQRTSQIPVTGFTTSTLPDTGFSGEWWDSTSNGWLEEVVALCIVDYSLPFHDARLQQAIGELKRKIDQEYKDHNSEQEQIWIVAQEAYLYA